MQTFLDDLKKAMDESSISQSELSRMSGVKQYNISKFLSGDRDILLSNALKLWPFVYGKQGALPNGDPVPAPQQEQRL